MPVASHYKGLSTRKWQMQFPGGFHEFRPEFIGQITGGKAAQSKGAPAQAV
jgi:hypothetical protein